MHAAGFSVHYRAHVIPYVLLRSLAPEGSTASVIGLFHPSRFRSSER